MATHLDLDPIVIDVIGSLGGVGGLSGGPSSQIWWLRRGYKYDTLDPRPPAVNVGDPPPPQNPTGPVVDVGEPPPTPCEKKIGELFGGPGAVADLGQTPVTLLHGTAGMRRFADHSAEGGVIHLYTNKYGTEATVGLFVPQGYDQTAYGVARHTIKELDYNSALSHMRAALKQPVGDAVVDH